MPVHPPWTGLPLGQPLCQFADVLLHPELSGIDAQAVLARHLKGQRAPVSRAMTEHPEEGGDLRAMPAPDVWHRQTSFMTKPAAW